MKESQSSLSADGRLTVVLFFLFGLLLYNLIINQQWFFFKRNNHYSSAERLSFVHPNSLIIENSLVADRELENEILQAIVTPFFFELIPINSADKNMLMTVRGIGPVMADDIVAYRDQNGPFKNGIDLQKIKGIGVKRAINFSTAFTFTEVP